MAEEDNNGTARNVTCQFTSESGEETGPQIDLQIDISKKKLEILCNAVLQQVTAEKTEEPIPFAFYINEHEITTTLEETLSQDETKHEDTETVVKIRYEPQAVFKVRAVTRCTSTLEGHAEAVLSAQFSADGRFLASGSGDTTVRFWDVNTETPTHTCKAHRHWVLAIAWSPGGNKLASGCKNSMVCIWNPQTGAQIGKSLIGHKQWITSLCWKPLHLDPEERYLASASKDGTVRIWDTVLQQCKMVLSGHLQSVTCVRWGGTDLIYTGSQDRLVKVWRAADGALCRTMKGHAHWVNTMALSTDYVIRTAAFEPAKAEEYLQELHKMAENKPKPEELATKARERYEKVKGDNPERLVTGSDDFTMFLWHPEEKTKPVERMTGHQQLINQVQFSPDTRLIASASFDKSIKLWDGFTGKFLASLRGHVQRVYQVAWSADSRLLCTGSADSTIKLHDVRKRKLLQDLPGHADEVYAVDWSPDGQRVVSGGKDKRLKIWRQ